MKTTLELPDDLMWELEILAAREGREMKDIIAESLRRDLQISPPKRRPSLRDIVPVSVGRILSLEESRDTMEEMLNDRRHQY